MSDSLNAKMIGLLKDEKTLNNMNFKNSIGYLPHIQNAGQVTLTSKPQFQHFFNEKKK